MSELKNALINIAEEVRTKVIPENIKIGVQIFDTEGAFLGDTLDTSDATATAEDILKDKTAYVNGEKVVGTLEVSSGGEEYNAKLAIDIATKDGYVSGQLTPIELLDLDASNISNTLRSAFLNYTRLKKISLKNTSKITTAITMCKGCTSLETVEIFDTNKLTNWSNAFVNCTSLSDYSLNNIMAMCINATSYTSTKTLAKVGLTSDQATRCQSLSNYEVFIAAGWTTGY